MRKRQTSAVSSDELQNLAHAPEILFKSGAVNIVRQPAFSRVYDIATAALEVQFERV